MSMSEEDERERSIRGRPYGRRPSSPRQAQEARTESGLVVKKVRSAPPPVPRARQEAHDPWMLGTLDPSVIWDGGAMFPSPKAQKKSGVPSGGLTELDYNMGF
jgi:hypothetical protein